MARSPRTIFVAAGGGGDALAAMMLAHACGVAGKDALVASFAWERTMFDPRPGPRPPSHFLDLHRRGSLNWEVTRRSRLADRRATSFLPRLANDRSTPLWLLDPTAGALGISRQLHEAVRMHQAERVIAVDVGGDILATGRESRVTSPTADALVLAAMARLTVETHVAVLGLGLDGEGINRSGYGQPTQINRAAGIPGHLPAHTARQFTPSLEWSPSEATALAYLAARGWRGRAEIRGQGLTVTVDETASRISVFEAAAVLARSRLAQELIRTRSFDAVEAHVRQHGYTPETEVERAARRARSPALLTPMELQQLDAKLMDYCLDAAWRGIDFLTRRRIGEVLGLAPEPLGQFVRYLATRYTNSGSLPAWRVRDQF